MSMPKQRTGCCGLQPGSEDSELGGPSEECSTERGIAEAEKFDKTMSWLKRNFKSNRQQHDAPRQPGQETMRRNFWADGRRSFKSFRSEWDIRSHAETVVQALSTRRVYLLRYVRAAVFVLNIRTLLMCVLACVIVYLCESNHLDLRFRQDFSIISVGTIFPLVFAIQQAFTRREEALREMAFLKAQLMGIYFCNRDWDISDGLLIRANLGNDSSEHALRCQQLILKFLTTLKQWLVSHTVYESESERRSLEARGWLPAFVHGEGQGLHLDAKHSASFTQRVTDAERADGQKQLYYQCYHYLSQLNVLNETLMAKANYPKAGEGGMSRLAQYIAKSTEALERLRYLREYRTPFMLRHVSFILILVSIFLMSPYFAFMCTESKWQTDKSGGCPAGYVMAVLYVVVVCTLYGVQVALENPFDGEGMDDVYFDLPREFEETMQRYARAGNFHKASAGTIVGNSVYVLGSSGIPPTGYSNYPGGLGGAAGGGAAASATELILHANGSGGVGPGGLSPAQTLMTRTSAEQSPLLHGQQSAHHGHTASLRRSAIAHQAAAAAAAGRPSHEQQRQQQQQQQQLQQLHAQQQHQLGQQPAGAPAGDASGSKDTAAAMAVTHTDATHVSSNINVVGTGGDGSSVCGGGGSGYPTTSPTLHSSPGPVLVTNASFAGARCPPLAAQIPQPRQQQASRTAPPPPVRIFPNGNAGPGYIGTAAAGGTDTASSGPTPFGEIGFQSVFLTEQLQHQHQQQLPTPSAANPAAVSSSRIDDDRQPASAAVVPAAAAMAAAAAAAAVAAAAAEASERSAGSPFQRTSMRLPAGHALHDSSANSLPRAGPFHRPGLGVPVGAAAVGLTDPHQLLVAGGSGPGIIMRLSGASPTASSGGGSAAAGRGGGSTWGGGGGHHRPQQHSARALGVAGLAGRQQQQALSGGSPCSTVPGTPFVPGSHGTSLSGMHGVASRTSLGGAVLFAMDQEGGSVGPVLVPDMPRGDADSPTAQDAIEADLARGMLGHMHVAPLPDSEHFTPGQSPPT